MEQELAGKQQVIFESALELIKERGFHGTPMSLIAERANVAAGTLYHYFESKEMLICSLFQYTRRRMIDTVNSCINPNHSTKEQFLNIWKCLYKFYTDNPSTLGFFEQFVNSPFYVSKGKAVCDEFYTHLVGFFKAGFNRGEFHTLRPEILGYVFHGNIITMAKVHRLGKIKLKEAELNQVALMLWRGITVPVPA